MWDVAARRPGWALIAVAGLTILLGAGIARIDAQVDFVDTVPEHSGLDAYREMIAELDGIRFVAVYMPHEPTHPSTSLREDDGFAALVAQQGQLTDDLNQQFPGIFSHTLSVYEGMRAGNYMLEKIATGGNPRAESYAVPDDPVRYQTVRDRGLDDGSFDDVLAMDGSSSILLAFFHTDDNREARALSGQVANYVSTWAGNGVTGHSEASGLLYASFVTDEQNRDDVLLWGGIALAAVAVALLLALRHPLDMLVSLASVALATVWTFGTLGWLGMELSFLSMFLAPAIIGIGIDHAVHVLHRAREEPHVAHAMQRIGKPVTVAALTTAGGLAALLFVPAPLFAEIGGVAALGILWSLVAALSFVPAVRRMYRPRRQAGSDRLGRALGRFAVHARRTPWPVLLVVAISIGAAALAASQTRLESGSSENEFPQDDPVIQLQQRIEAEYGAFQRAYIVVRGDMTDPAALNFLLEATGRVSEIPLFREASSVADLLLADAATDEGSIDLARDAIVGGAGQGASDAERLPQTAAEARVALDELFADPLWGSIAPFTITRDYDLAVVAITVTPWDSQAELTDLRNALLAIEADMAGALPQHSVRAAGSPLNRAAILEQTPTDIGIATLGTALAIGILLSIAWGGRRGEGLRVAALGLAMVLIAAVWLLATIPLLDWFYATRGTGNNAALNDMFLLAFAITVAVGIDDLVHVASRFWEARDGGASKDAALRTAFEHAGRAITGTSFTTFVAFAILSGTYFLQSKNLAILTATGVVFAYGLTLLLAPRILAGGRNA